MTLLMAILLLRSIHTWRQTTAFFAVTLGLHGNKWSYSHCTCNSDARQRCRRWMGYIPIHCECDNDKKMLSFGVMCERTFIENNEVVPKWNQYRLSHSEVDVSLTLSVNGPSSSRTLTLSPTGHADGVVSFLDENTIILPDYGDEEDFNLRWDHIRACYPQWKYPNLNIVRMENYIGKLRHISGITPGRLSKCR